MVRTFCGHAIGKEFHGDLSIPHYDEPQAVTVLEPGMTFTIEPMITMGSWRERIWPDGWTAVTADGLRTAQYEHTLVVTDDGVEVLTPSESLPAPLSVADASGDQLGSRPLSARTWSSSGASSATSTTVPNGPPGSATCPGSWNMAQHLHRAPRATPGRVSKS